MGRARVDTPWLVTSGGRWPEVLFNHVPSVSVLPDPDPFGRYSLYDEPTRLDDDEGTGARSPRVSHTRIRADLDYDTAMRDLFTRTLGCLGEHRDARFAIDAIHLDVLNETGPGQRPTNPRVAPDARRSHGNRSPPRGSAVATV